MYISYYHILITVSNNISNNYLKWDSNIYLHYIRMQEYRLSDIYYIWWLICILFYAHKPLAQDKLMAQQAEWTRLTLGPDKWIATLGTRQLNFLNNVMLTPTDPQFCLIVSSIEMKF